jgi:2-keto-4-pentenoate hydratase
MEMTRGSETVSRGMGGACLGNPLHALRWLAETLAANGHPLKAGDVVMSGALGPMVAAQPGDAFEARIEGLGSVRASFAAN